MKRTLLILLIAFLFLYAAMPFVAGLLGMGDRRGPLVYPQVYHEIVFACGYELRFGEKPRISFGRGRPLFYGLHAPELKIRKTDENVGK